MNNFSFTNLIVGLASSIIAIILESALVKLGVVRGNFIGLVLVLIFAIILMNTIEMQDSILSFAAFIAILGPFGINRADVIDTTMKGRWSWKDNEESQ
ncbi:MAG: hypothetical protein HN736_00065 [Anaerolineae bacterium]|jgi:hypothetical protein|nr:hypothetical protein [Anaerolineae bacterium]MBT4310896.1 hypothetical protein [Anaerolineae bacterium]MBT4460192.1 hypothetical protein [Anaerolineae bacterium]MBT4843383.1 hypothetical protein [Anaerolineae bacterium]MBT6321285.1 hypothetical protein [Anaerolineae bacterium]